MTRESVSKAKEAVVSRVWLYYYNKVLFERGVITERERNKMAVKILNWTAPRNKA